MAYSTREKMTNVGFQVISCDGVTPPKLSFHSCSLVRNKFYIYGGVDDKKSVQNGMFCFDPLSNHWYVVSSSRPKTELKSPRFKALAISEPPRLSHHTATVLSDRYILFIGGWTGQKRTSEAFYFDTCENTWFQYEISGDVPVGLSSHTSTLVSEVDVIIVGREGGVRTQRRSGDAFYFNAETGVFKEALVHVSSRSGHTANLVKSPLGKSYRLFIQGGRKGSEYQMIGSWRPKPETSRGSGLRKDKISSLLNGCVVSAEPKGRQHCTAVELSDSYLLFFGGETWTGVRNNTSNEMYILDCQKMKWYCQPSTVSGVPCLTGHVMGILEDRVFVFGGLLEGKCCNNVWLMQL